MKIEQIENIVEDLAQIRPPLGSMKNQCTNFLLFLSFLMSFSSFE